MNEKMSSANHAINWFEIPATDIARAKTFYECIFEITMQEMEMPDMKYAMFPFDPKNRKVAGAIAQSSFHTPSATGSIIYLNANPDLQNVLDRIEKAGGKVTMPKTSIGVNGFMAFFIDSEGNGMALHSNT
jgi:predicted enzyme related to lactoylglutathione lyase